MRQTVAAFERRGVPAFYRSLHPQAKRERWERRQTKIEARKTKASNPETSVKPRKKPGAKNDSQLSLFD